MHQRSRESRSDVFAPKIEEWSDIHMPFVVAAVTAVLGAVVVVVRRKSLTDEDEGEAEELETRHAIEDGVGVFASQDAVGRLSNWRPPEACW